MSNNEHGPEFNTVTKQVGAFAKALDNRMIYRTDNARPAEWHDEASPQELLQRFEQDFHEFMDTFEAGLNNGDTDLETLRNKAMDCAAYFCIIANMTGALDE